MNIQLSVADWLELPIEIRNTLRELFDIPKSKGTIVESNTVISDGTTYEDLASLTVEKMQEYLNTTDSTDFKDLFDRVTALIETSQIVETPTSVLDPKQLMLDEWIAILNRMKGQAVEHSMIEHLHTAVKRIFEINPPVINTNVQTKRTTKAKKTK